MQSHIQQIAAMLRVGDDGSYALMSDAAVLDNHDIMVLSVLGIPENYVFDPEDDYCPTSNIPDEVSARYPLRTVQYVGDKVYVLGDNGMCMFMVRGTRQTN